MKRACRNSRLEWKKKFPVKFKHTKSGKACVSTSLAVKSGRGGEILWFTLIFWNELAETVAWHLKMNDSVYVSGFFGLGTTTGADDKLQRYKVIALFFLFPKIFFFFPTKTSFLSL